MVVSPAEIHSTRELLRLAFRSAADAMGEWLEDVTLPASLRDELMADEDRLDRWACWELPTEVVGAFLDSWYASRSMSTESVDNEVLDTTTQACRVSVMKGGEAGQLREAKG